MKMGVLGERWRGERILFVLCVHVDSTAKLHNEQKQTFINLSRCRCLSGDHSSMWPQHLPCKQLPGETTNTPRDFSQASGSPDSEGRGLQSEFESHSGWCSSLALQVPPNPQPHLCQTKLRVVGQLWRRFSKKDQAPVRGAGSGGAAAQPLAWLGKAHSLLWGSPSTR